MVEYAVQELIYSFSNLIIFVMGLVSVVVTNIATYGAQRVLDVISSICLRLCHRYVGRLLGDTDGVGRRGRSVQPVGGQVAGTGVRGVAEARGLVDIEAQVHVGDSCVVASDGVIGSSSDLSMNVVTTE